MVEFQELSVTPDGKNLIIDVSVKDLSYYTDVYLDSIIIDTQDTYVSTGPSSKPVFSYEVTAANAEIYEATGIVKVTAEDTNTIYAAAEEGEKRVRLELNNTALGTDINSNLFFVYVVTKGTPTADTPCGMDNNTSMAVVANLHPFYRSIVACMKEVEDECNVSTSFINKLLQFKALELSIKTGHYTEAVKYWNKFFKKVKSNIVTKKCNCHG